MRARRLMFLVGLVGSLALVPDVAAADPLVVSGRLTPLLENDAADPDGHGVAALTISADRTQLTYRITFGDVAVPITAVYFCAGEMPRAIPISITCPFVISPSAGGLSPITGTRSILPAQADVLASGYAVIQLDSAAGPQLAGYIEIGPPPPDTSTSVGHVSAPRIVASILPAIAALLAFVLVALSPSSRRGTGGHRPTNHGPAGGPVKAITGSGHQPS